MLADIVYIIGTIYNAHIVKIGSKDLELCVPLHGGREHLYSVGLSTFIY